VILKYIHSDTEFCKVDTKVCKGIKTIRLVPNSINVDTKVYTGLYVSLYWLIN